MNKNNCTKLERLTAQMKLWQVDLSLAEARFDRQGVQRAKDKIKMYKREIREAQKEEVEIEKTKKNLLV